MKEYPMRRKLYSAAASVVMVATLWQAATIGNNSARAYNGWEGERRVSYQQQKDLFYNYYAQPGPFYNTAGSMYVSPQPVPPRVGHTYVSYQPFMPHEYLYQHHRSYYNYNPGDGWTRTNVRYGTCCNYFEEICADWHFPMSNNIMALHTNFYYPGVRF
jgi:hypothetical protein